MNIHPLIVHFPIAFLTLYVFVELVPIQLFKSIKVPVLFFGILGAFAALLTGVIAEKIIGESIYISLHAKLNFLATLIFSILAWSYFIEQISDNHLFDSFKIKPVWDLVLLGQKIVANRFVTVSLAVLGFVLLTLAGALGGSLLLDPVLIP